MTRSCPGARWPARLRKASLAATLALACTLTASPLTGAPLPGTEIATIGTIALEVSKGKIIRLERPAVAVFVADPEIADVQAQSPTMVYLFGKRAGATSFYAVDANDELLIGHEVQVSHDLSRLRSLIDELMPEADITISSIDQSIVIEGLVNSPTEAQELREFAGRFLGEEETLINRIRVAAPTQVNLRVRITEVEREVTKQFGINWRGLFTAGDFVFGIASGRSILSADRTGSTGIIGRSNSNADAIQLGYSSGDIDINGIIDALEEEGLINVLAEPNLTALSGETASFLAGGEFPVPVGVDDGDITIEFKEFGVMLAFTPTVLSHDRISLKVRPEVSELSENGAIMIKGTVIPALSVRRAETTVELGSGQSFAIGGLLQNDVENNVDKFPGLGDVPVVGALFRSQRFQRKESELVIIVTPYIVRPVDEPTLATPSDGYRAPSDVERIFEGRLAGASLKRGSAGPIGPGGARLVGAAGFELE